MWWRSCFFNRPSRQTPPISRKAGNAIRKRDLLLREPRLSKLFKTRSRNSVRDFFLHFSAKLKTRLKKEEGEREREKLMKLRSRIKIFLRIFLNRSLKNRESLNFIRDPEINEFSFDEHSISKLEKRCFQKIILEISKVFFQ